MTLETNRAITLCVLLGAACADAEPDEVSWRSDDYSEKAAALADELGIDERELGRIEEALEKEATVPVEEVDRATFEEIGALLEEAHTLDPERAGDARRLGVIEDELVAIVSEFDPALGRDTFVYSITGNLYCFFATQFTTMVRSFAGVAETYSVANFQQNGSGDSFVAAFASIAAHLDALEAEDWAINGSGSTAQYWATVKLQQVEADAILAETYGYADYAAQGNPNAELGAQWSGVTAQYAGTTAGWMAQCVPDP